MKARHCLACCPAATIAGWRRTELGRRIDNDLQVVWCRDDDANYATVLVGYAMNFDDLGHLGERFRRAGAHGWCEA